MGLDMYLTLKRKGHDDEEVGYWRKANAVHRWFSEVMLPTQCGFFFGDAGYGEYYVECLKSTIDICNRAIKLLEETPAEEKPRIVYQSSW